jgi:hypothetical protein
MNKSNRKKRNRSRNRNPWNVVHEPALAVAPHEPVAVDVFVPDAGATPRLGGEVTLAVGYRFMEDHYEPFAHVQLTQQFLDRVYQLARLVRDEGLEYVELDHRITWNCNVGRRRPQRLRIARNHFYWTACWHEALSELNTAPVLFKDLEERLPLAPTDGTGIVFMAIEDPDEQDEVLQELRPAPKLQE